MRINEAISNSSGEVKLDPKFIPSEIFNEITAVEIEEEWKSVEKHGKRYFDFHSFLFSKI